MAELRASGCEVGVVQSVDGMRIYERMVQVGAIYTVPAHFAGSNSSPTLDTLAAMPSAVLARTGASDSPVQRIAVVDRMQWARILTADEEELWL